MPSQGADGSQISGNEIHSKLLLLIEIKSILHVGGGKNIHVLLSTQF